jgi:hypothetical protein
MPKLKAISLRLAAYIPTVLIAVVIVSAVAFAQNFVEPTTNAPGGNTPAPVLKNGNTQIKSGDVTMATIGSDNGFVLSSTGSAGNATWNVLGGLATLTLQKFCLSGTCITDLSAFQPAADIYLNNQSCNGGWCAPDLNTLSHVCFVNGYSHVANVITGGDWSNQTECLYNPTTSLFECGGGCSSNCGNRAATRVSCDNH